MNTMTDELFTERFPPAKGPVVLEHRYSSFPWTCAICKDWFAPQITLCYFQDDKLKMRTCLHHDIKRRAEVGNG